ncbi:tetratricopeptide repeat protein [Clostridium kluyveri]|uniref:Uncharacterized protein n=1 Tax=Clostridium kluyveri TaxID=1534 RepID=A0A1L5F2Y4_CLOKL|nr:tetratricopeptide repeat protein [Clostridium kluyveri]APM37369.1 hypothetical protein BS101_00595 [Clostridium kluyveri]
MLKKLLSKLAIMSIVILSVGFVGCAPKGDPAQVLNSYYDNIKNGDAEAAYDTLAEASKKNFQKEDFIKWIKTQSETYTFKGAKVDKGNEYKNKKLDNVTYENAVEFNVADSSHDNYNNKDTSVNYKRYVVNDNGEWKVYREKENGKDVLTDSMNDLAWMYIEGKGKDKDLNQGATILNEAIKISPSYNESYYALSYVYSHLERYDESISAANKYIENTKTNEEKSNAYNILGLGYEGKKDYENAKKYFNQAIQLDSNNQYAKTNLQQLEQLEQLSSVFD